MVARQTSDESQNTMRPIPFDNSYQTLADSLFHRQQAEPVSSPQALLINTGLAEALNIDSKWLASPAGIDVLSGNELAAGSQPIACVYAGHQFGNYNPQLGDGRALLLGEVIDRQGQRKDIQLKGSGRTPYSRGGDGRSPLGPVIREYLLSEAMHCLGVPSTRALAALATGDPVFREHGPLPGGILCRVASSHLRVGTVQFVAAQQDPELLQQLMDYVIDRHYPECKQSESTYEALFNAILNAQAKLISRWQALGFIHGVMNTDNMLLCAETIDYGPCAFMEAYHPGTVFSSIDQQGRYAYGNQPAIAQWNLVQLAQAMLTLMQRPGESDLKPAVQRAQDALNTFPDTFLQAYRQRMAEKLGFSHINDDDEALYRDFLALLEEHDCDFTLSFRSLNDRAAVLANCERGGDSIAGLFQLPDAFAPWLERWQQRFNADATPAEQRYLTMQKANPVFIPRNHLVESAIEKAYEGDMGVFFALQTRLQAPFEYQCDAAEFAAPATDGNRVTATFCGT